jgi:hypothetical protein
MNEQEYDSPRAVLTETVQTITIILEILVRLAGFDIEDVDENAYMLEYRRSLGCEIRVHERILAATVPEVEDKISQETDVVLLDVDGCSQPRGQRCRVVGTEVGIPTMNVRESKTPSVRTHKMRDRIDVLPLPDAPIKRICMAE